MKNTPVISPTSVAVFMTTLFIASGLFADGFRNSPEGARAIGAFGGHRVFSDDANATIHNSANLVDLEQPMIQLNATFGYGRSSFKTGGISDETRKPYYAIPGFSAALPLKEGKYALGVAAYVPFGRSVEWGLDSVFAQNNVSYEGSMSVMDITPNFAVRVTDQISVGVGADLYFGDVDQRTLFTGPAAELLGLPPGTESRLSADGDAIGWNAAITWKMTDNQRLAATIRSPFSIKYEGDNDLSVGMQSKVNAEIDYPTIVALAYGIELSDTLRVEVNGEWLEFSRYETLVIHDSVSGPQSIAQNLDDTWTAGIGAEWEFVPQWTLRSGLMYLENPTPDETYSPLTPDVDQGVISMGIGYETDLYIFDLGYAYGLFDSRSISGSANSPDGTYDYDVQLLSFSYGYKF